MNTRWLRNAWLAVAALAAMGRAAMGAEIELSFPGSELVEAPGPSVRWLQARRLESLPEVDGALTDPCWKRGAEAVWSGSSR